MRGLLILLFFGACLSSLFFDDKYWTSREIDGPVESTSSSQSVMNLITNLKIIEEFNKLYEKGEITFKLKLNQFAYMSPSMFCKTMNGYRRPSMFYGPPEHQFVSTNAPVPPFVDWRQRGAVTPVKNQGNCGSCWAFSATGSLEGGTFINKGVLVELSEQNLIDCSKSYGNNGCQGGVMELAFKYVKDNGGINTADSYPYTGNDTQPCRYLPQNNGATVSGIVRVPQNETLLMEAVAQIGPVSVAIDASHVSFQFYSSGVYYEPACSSTRLNHGVLVVGYGTEKGVDYWLVKNSWGSAWGDKGYVKMARNRNNNCGIVTDATYPIVG